MIVFWLSDGFAYAAN